MKNLVIPTRTMARTVLLAIAGFVIAAVPMRSHHSQTMYDMAKEVTVKGVVTKFEWSNPHSWVYLDAVDAQGKPEAWEFETLSQNSLTRAGWTRTQVKAGEPITVVGNPRKDGSKRAHIARIVLADGKVLLPGRDPSSGTAAR